MFVREPAVDTPVKTPLSQQHADAFRGFTFTREFNIIYLILHELSVIQISRTKKSFIELSQDELF